MTPETEKLLFFLEPLEDGADLPDFFRAEVLEVFEPLQGEGEKFVLRFRLRLRGGSDEKGRDGPGEGAYESRSPPASA